MPGTDRQGVDQVVKVSAGDYDGAVFDMDGVITDTATLHRRVWKSVLDDFLIDHVRAGERPQPPFSADDYLRYVDGKHRNDGVASFLHARGVVLPMGSADDAPGVDSIWALANRKDAAFHRAMDQYGVQAFESSVALVRALQAAGLGTAIVSASRNCRAILRAAGVPDLFPVCVDGNEAGLLGLPGKPSPAVFLEAARRLNAAADRSIVVEDAIAGVQAGRAGRFGLVIGVDRTGSSADLLTEGADVVVEDLGQVSVIT